IVVQTLLDDLLTEDVIAQIVKLAEEHLQEEETNCADGVYELRTEIESLDKEVSKLVELLTKVEHQRALLERLDDLESRRTELQANLEEYEQEEPEYLLDGYSNIAAFLRDFRAGL